VVIRNLGLESCKIIQGKMGWSQAKIPYCKRSVVKYSSYTIPKYGLVENLTAKTNYIAQNWLKPVLAGSLSGESKRTAKRSLFI